MNTSRRSFLRASSLAGLAAAITASFPKTALGQTRRAYTQLPREVYASPLYNLSHNNFYGNIGTLFTFKHPTKGSVALRLVAVADLTPHIGKNRPESKESF